MSYLSKLLTRPPILNCFRSTMPKLYTNAPRKITCLPTKFKYSPYSTIRIIPVKSKDECEPTLMEHDSHNKKLGRPLSPHLGIYKAELTSFLSFLHRMSGITMTLYVYAVVVGTWIWRDSNEFFELMSGMDEYVGETGFWWAHRIVRLCVALPFIYHSFNGFRHLSWDFGRFLSMRAIYITGYIVSAAVLLTVGFLVFYL